MRAHHRHCGGLAILETTILMQDSTSWLYVDAHRPRQYLLCVGAIGPEPRYGLLQHDASVRDRLSAHPPQRTDDERGHSVGIACAVVALIVRV